MKDEEESFQNNDEEDVDEDLEIIDGVEIDEKLSDEEQAPQQKQKLSKKAKKKSKSQQQVPLDLHEESEVDELEKPLQEVSIVNVSDDSDDWAGSNKKNKKSKQKKGKPSKQQPTKEEEPKASEPDNITENGTSKKSSKKGKKSAVTDDSNSIENNVDISHTCVTCHSTFDSKNKLFNHLKKTNHGVYIPKATTAAASTTGKRSKK